MLSLGKTIQEKRAIQFAIELISKFGYGYTITIPSRVLATQLTEKGKPISFITVIKYWETLERLGYVSKECKAKIFGVTYTLNRYALNKLIRKNN